MTGRVLYILREHGDWKTTNDLQLLYLTMLDNGFSPDDMDDNSLRLLAESFVNTNDGYIYKIFWTPKYEIEGDENV